MPKYKIGITEAGDAGIDLSWEYKLGTVDGAILITKDVNKDFIEAVMRNRDKVIVHATCTGYGGTIIEPNVPNFENNFSNIRELISYGFPKDRIVIRVDPIIPTEKGIYRAKTIIGIAIRDLDIFRFRVSIIDLYNHVKKRFKSNGIPLPFDKYPSPKQISDVNSMISDIYDKYSYLPLRIESCAEPKLTHCIKCGCISDYDLKLLGLSDENGTYSGFQRKNCMCYDGKIELLSHKNQCKHGCLYCYWI